MTFSKDLSFDSHVGTISDKISKLSGYIIRCTKKMSSAALLNLYKSPILPHLVYCVCVWAPFQRNHIDRLEKIQRKITCISFYRRFSCDADSRPSHIERLIELHLMKIEDVLKFSSLVFGYKLLNGLLPDSFGSLVQQSRLNSSRLLHVTARTSSFFYSMSVTLPRLWNEIPSDIQDSKNLVAFKSGYRSFILNSYV